MEAIKSTRKIEMVQLAASLFRKKGYFATSMRDLANHLGIEAASLYSHIRSKEELLENICFRLGAELLESLDRIESGSLTYSQQLEFAIQSHLAVITRSPDEAQVFLLEYKHLTEPRLSAFLKMRKEYELRFRIILRQGMQQGEFRRADEKMVTLTLLSALNSTPTWFRSDKGMNAEQVSAVLTDLLIQGLASPVTPVFSTINPSL